YAANRLLDIDAAQEVVQLTFIREYEQLNEYQSERDFGVWLCVICKHFILTELERQRRESRNLAKFSHALRLRVGVATVRVSGEIKGFVLLNPHQRVTDLGTSFGVDVDTKGDTAISVFEGEIELEDRRRLVGGQTVALTATGKSPREIPYAISQFLNTWQVSFGVEQLVGDVRVASPGERHSPGLARDGDSLLLFPEREDALLEHGYVVDGIEPGTYRRPFRKHTVKLTKDVRVDSFLLQYNPGHDDAVSRNQKFQGELHFDRPIVALILQKDLLDSSDALLALPETDFRNIFRRGINGRILDLQGQPIAGVKVSFNALQVPLPESPGIAAWRKAIGDRPDGMSVQRKFFS
ncbi:unnamed protein product, partial [Hapterophycus canaliculatus]